MEKVVVIIVLALVILSIYAIVDMQKIAIRRYKIKGKDTLKIVQFSDIHKRTFGEGNCRLVSLIKSTKPDILVITGDLVSRNQQDTSQLEILIQEACKLTTVYFIYGNHEMDMDKRILNPLVKRLENFGAILLDNQGVQVAKNTYLWGLTLPVECYHDENYGYKNVHFYLTSDLPSSLKSLDKLLVNQIFTENDKFNILLVHNPLFFKTYSEFNINLVLSGHVHGGVIKLPMLNVGLLSPERKILPKYHGGLYRLNGKTMIVSRGLGKLRLFNPPEISIIEVEKS